MKIKEDFIQQIWSLQQIPRWDDEAPRLPDDFASHTGRVAIFSLIAGLIQNEIYGDTLDLEKLVCRALFHDLKVNFTGSINHATKKDPLVSEMIQDIERNGSNEFVQGLNPKAQDSFYDYVVCAQDDSKEGKLLRAIDSFDALMFCHREDLFGSTYYFPEKKEELQWELDNIDIPCIRHFMDAYYRKDTLYLFLLSVTMLDRVRRWKGKFSLIPDNDGIHLFRASAMAAYLTVIEQNVYGKDINLLHVVASTLTHDVVEKRTGDVLGPVKHASPEIKAAFERYEEKIAGEMVEMLPVEIQPFFVDHMVHAKDDSDKGNMVDLVDKLDALLKANIERVINPFHYQQDYEDLLAKITSSFDRPALHYFFESLFIPNTKS